MALSTAEREAACREWIEEEYVAADKTAEINLDDLVAAAVYTDDWIDTNQGDFVSGLPTTFKNNSTANEKVRLFIKVLRKRAGL